MSTTLTTTLEQTAVTNLLTVLSKIESHQPQAPAALGAPGPQMTELLKGRQKVAVNAVKMGVTGQKMFLTADEFPMYMAIGRDLMKEFRPRTMRDVLLAQRLIDNNWRCQRISALENNLLMVGLIKRADTHVQDDEDSQALISQTLAYEDDCARNNCFDKLSRHEVRLTRIGMQLEQHYDRRQRRHRGAFGQAVPFDMEQCKAYKWYEAMALLGADLIVAREELKAAREQLDQIPSTEPATHPESATSAPPLICKKLTPNSQSALAFAAEDGLLTDHEVQLFKKLVGQSTSPASSTDAAAA